jgi:hypothetical protein
LSNVLAKNLCTSEVNMHNVRSGEVRLNMRKDSNNTLRRSHHVKLLSTHEWNIAEEERPSGGGREGTVQIGCGCEQDADQVIVG